MRSFPIPFNEQARLEAIAALGLRDEAAVPALDAIAEVARRVMGTPTALVSLVERDRQAFRARAGFDLSETPRDYAICAHAIMADAPLVVPDTHADPRFVRHPVVVNPPHVRFYVGAPIILSSGFRVGTLCALDFIPRERPSEESVRILTGLAGAVAAVLDMRARRPAAAADTSGGAREVFLSLISHELLTPLNGVLGLGALLEVRLRSDAESAALLAGMLTSGRHLTRIVERILQFSDISTGDLRLSETEVDPARFLEHACALTAPAALLAGKTIHAEPCAVAGTFRGDTEQLGIALCSLLDNAVLHGGPAIRVGCARDAAGELVFEVVDDGAGVDAAGLRAACEPFGVAGDVTRRAAGGLGLGLPLARRLTELHGGELDLRRERGVTVASIRLPAWRSEPVAGAVCG